MSIGKNAHFAESKSYLIGIVPNAYMQNLLNHGDLA
jgi:hypothetical protein